ncbi:MAG: Nramp family divalent metal transporter [Caulobacteraceae bacterium]
MPAGAWSAGLDGSFRSIAVPPQAGYWRKLAAFAGPGYLVAVGYMDPGNWATDIAGGSRFGYALLSVIFLSNFVAMFLQWQSLRLGIASGQNLAQLCHERFGRRIVIALWAVSEVAIVACDLAEVIGTAIALQLLFHLPLLAGSMITVVDTLVIMGLQRRGFRYIEALVITLTGVIGACFVVELILCKPDGGAILRGLTPSAHLLANPAMLYIALGIFGATVMPHNLYLHSAVAQTRRFERTPAGRREAIHFSTVDCFAALGLALFVNAAILILAAAAFHATGHAGVARIADAYKLLAPLFGTAAASVLFALALLASGQNSTLTGTLAGQIVMEGFLGLRMKPWIRRLATRAAAVVPTVVVLALFGEASADRLLIFSQVILSLQLGFAVIPLILFTGDATIMGPFVSGARVKAIGWGVGAAIVGVNGWLVVQTLAR